MAVKHKRSKSTIRPLPQDDQAGTPPSPQTSPVLSAQVPAQASQQQDASSRRGSVAKRTGGNDSSNISNNKGGLSTTPSPPPSPSTSPSAATSLPKNQQLPRSTIPADLDSMLACKNHVSVRLCQRCGTFDYPESWKVSAMDGKVMGRGVVGTAADKYVVTNGLCDKHAHLWKEMPTPIPPVSIAGKPRRVRSQRQIAVESDNEGVNLSRDLLDYSQGMQRKRPWAKSKL